MNLTLHLTENCNMNCAYCVYEKTSRHMSREVLHKAVKLAYSFGTYAGICFFGGEPLLEQNLIYEALALCAEHTRETGKPAQFKITTNGTLLTEDFLKHAKQVKMSIGLSFDGLAQDTCRHFANGGESFATVEEKAKLTLRYLPLTSAMMTIAPQTAGKFSSSVRYLYELGFRRIMATIAYGCKVQWTDEALTVLKGQLEEIAVFFSERLLAGKPFYFSPIDTKIRDLLTGYPTAERCHLGIRQMSVAPDGKIYACTQFINDEAYCLGDVFNGLIPEKCIKLTEREATPATCRECALQTRCISSCGCLNRLETGNERKVSPLQCSYERMLIALADETASKLYETTPEIFTKHFKR